jgi:hypothetical protein
LTNSFYGNLLQRVRQSILFLNRQSFQIDGLEILPSHLILNLGEVQFNKV